MARNYKVTSSGKLELEKELEDLKNSRGEIAEKIAVARSFGDLSENTEYDAARSEQNVAESRIAEIEEILHNVEIIDETTPKSKIELGSSVTLNDGKKDQVYNLVGPIEANPLEFKISNESPLGQALIGKKVGETAEIKTPKGKLQYNIISIK